MIHRIHTGEELTQDYTIIGRNGSVNNFNEVRFPGDRRDCTTCHLDDTQQVLGLRRRASSRPQTPRDWYTPMQPTATACLACHDSQAAAAHAFVKTAPFGEAFAEACAAATARTRSSRSTRCTRSRYGRGGPRRVLEGVRRCEEPRATLAAVACGRSGGDLRSLVATMRRQRRHRPPHAGLLPSPTPVRLRRRRFHRRAVREPSRLRPSASTATRSRSRASRATRTRARTERPRIRRRFCSNCHGDGTEHIEDGGDPADPDLPRARRRRELPLLPREDRTRTVRSRSGSTANSAAVNCLSCHSIHSKGARERAPAGEGDGAALPDLPHRNRRLVPQQAVHAPARSRRHDVRRLPRPARPQGPAGQDDPDGELACLTCHAEKRGPFVFDHVTGSAGNCLSCHQPHGSSNPKQLLWARVDQLCLSCHSKTGRPDDGGRPAAVVPRPDARPATATARPATSRCTGRTSRRRF